MLSTQLLERPVSREVGWEGALDSGRPSDYSPSRNDPEVMSDRVTTDLPPTQSLELSLHPGAV
jgi:hypothetical protein